MATGHVDVLLVGYQDQGNLGMGYLAAVLLEHGYSVELVDVRDGPDTISRRVRQASPLVVGYSLIFQFFLPQFRDVAIRLRKDGCTAHQTIGGHYASLCPDEVLAQLPELDSIARYEGEATLLELTQTVSAGGDWRAVPGLAYAGPDGALRESPPRALVQDLDSLPLPFRPRDAELILGFKTMPLLASRGCARQCSFCSIHTFYRTAPGKVVRIRSAERVVEEMQMLHDQHGIRVFLFQDDDFPLWGRSGAKWVDQLTWHLHDTGLADRVLWKISCRAEYVEPELFAPLRDAGLYMVYMGIESGVDAGLQMLHKQMTVQQNLDGIRILKELGLAFSYGFMLFDPSSTFESVRQNIGFLRQIVGDGSAGALFCRMLPYGGTPIRDQLAREGRLHGNVTHPDYDFLDKRLNAYHAVLDRSIAHWVHNHGISHQLNWARDELGTVRRIVPGLADVSAYDEALRRLTAHSNELVFRFVEDSSVAFEEHGEVPDERQAREVTAEVKRQLLDLRNSFVRLNANALLSAIEVADVVGPTVAPQVH